MLPESLKTCFLIRLLEKHTGTSKNTMNVWRSKNCANRAGYLGYFHIIVTTKIAESAKRVLPARDSQTTKAAFCWFTLYNKVNSEMVCYAGQAVTVVVGSTVTETTITEQLQSSGISKWCWWWKGGWPPWILPEVLCFDKILICPLRRVPVGVTTVSTYFWICFSELQLIFGFVFQVILLRIVP